MPGGGGGALGNGPGKCSRSREPGPDDGSLIQDNLRTDLSHAMWDKMWDRLTSRSENISNLLG